MTPAPADANVPEQPRVSPKPYASKYPVLTRTILEELANRDGANYELVKAVVEYVLGQINDDFAKEGEIVRALPAPFQAIYATWCLQGEVDNGGFTQYFWNSTGQFADEAQDGFLAMGATEFMTVVEEAITTILNSDHRWRDLRKSHTLDDFSESYNIIDFDELNKRFYALDAATPLIDIQAAYIREHLAEFVTEGRMR